MYVWQSESHAVVNMADTLALAVLGVCSEGPTTVARASDAIRCIGRGEWSPCTGTVWAAVERLVDAGLLQRESLGKRFELTDAGRNRFQVLLQSEPLSAATPIGRVGLSLRQCFLPSVPAAARDRVMRAILDAHARELDRFTAAAAAHRGATRGLVRRWLAACAARKRNEMRALSAEAQTAAGVRPPASEATRDGTFGDG